MKKINIILITITLVALLTACQEAAVAPKVPGDKNVLSSSYFPCSVGDEWYFEEIGLIYNPTAEKDTIVRRVTNVSNDSLYKSFIITTYFVYDTFKTEVFFYNEYYSIRNDSVFKLQYDSMGLEELVMITPIKQGTSWATYPNLPFKGINDTTFVETAVSVESEGGDFNVVYKIVKKSMINFDSPMIKYFVPNVGFIKEFDYSDRDVMAMERRLIKYKISK